jgi:PAS domain S-box-containing protein
VTGPRPELMPALFESVPDALVIVDGTGRIALANGHAERMFGYPAGGLAGLAIEALMPAGVRGRHVQHRDGYMAAPRVRPMGGTGQALIGQRLDGEQFPVEIALSPLASPEGPRFLASVRDISETQRARQALVRARYDATVARIGQRALESRDGGDVIDSLPRWLAESLDVEAVAVVFLQPDRGGGSDAVEVRATHGFDAGLLATALGEEAPDGGFGRALAQGRLQVVDDLADASPGGFALPGLLGGSTALVPLLDRERPMGALVALSRQPRRFDHDALHLLGSVANMLAALMQRRHTEEQLAHSQRLDAIGQLTGGIAHDFNNLLTIISGSLQLLEIEVGERPETADLIATALRSVGRGAELTTKLLAFARRQRLTPAAVDPVALLRDIEAMLRRTLGESIQLRVERPASLPAAHADATQLDTALVNLALNARDAMPRGGEILLSAREHEVVDAHGEDGLAPGRYVVFSVQDTGLGMAPETLARAVEPFFTTKELGRGSGLGLSMVYGFARQSGGALAIDSRLGYGTRVDLFLPASRHAAGVPASAAATPRQGRGETVLVVEDEPDVRAIAEGFLRSLGFATRAVGNAAEALAVLGGDAPLALMFSDVMLGEGLDGYALASAARQLRPELPVLLTSGYNEAATGRGNDAGLELLRKPYRREQLAEAIARQLRRG